MMVETTQAFAAADGRSPLPAFLDACEGRCTGVHLGVYDFTALPDQHGLSDNNVVMVAWDPKTKDWLPLSRLGSVPLKP